MKQDGTPDKFREIENARVYIGPEGKLIITAEPDEVWHELPEDMMPHNCDGMGCGWEHVIARVDLYTEDES